MDPSVCSEVDQEHETIESRGRDIAEEEEEGLVVPVSDAGVDPGAAVVALRHTVSAAVAVAGPGRPETFTGTAKFQTLFVGRILWAPAERWLVGADVRSSSWSERYPLETAYPLGMNPGPR